MSDHSKIEWTDATWNPVRGYTKISPGCAHCYAETFAEAAFRAMPSAKISTNPEAKINQLKKNIDQLTAVIYPSTALKSPIISPAGPALTENVRRGAWFPCRPRSTRECGHHLRPRGRVLSTRRSGYRYGRRSPWRRSPGDRARAAISCGHPSTRSDRR